MNRLFNLARLALPPPAACLALLAVTAMPGPANAAKGQCVRLIPDGGREVIFNACSTCRVIGITRKRPGNAVPVSRTYNVQPRSRFPVPFRGPGRSRITYELPCKGEPGAARNLVDPAPIKKAGGACVSLEKTRFGGGVALVNKCQVCKAALIERKDRTGGSHRQAYKVPPQSAMTVPSKGMAGVGLVGEIACP